MTAITTPGHLKEVAHDSGVDMTCSKLTAAGRLLVVAESGSLKLICIRLHARIPSVHAYSEAAEVEQSSKAIVIG